MAPLISHLPKLDPSGSLPLYVQLERALRQAIGAGVLGPDDSLPPERELAARLGVSRITVRKALDALATDGLLISRRGAGNFVAPAPHVEKQFGKLSSFSEDMRARGLVPSSEWLRRSEGVVSADEALKLGLSPGSTVYRFHRLRRADGRPMAIETATVVGSALPALDAVGDSLYQALEALGRRPVRALQRLTATLLDEEQARLLAVAPGSAGLLVERVGFGRDGRAIERTVSVYRADSFDFVAELVT
ncbi:MAG: GntR family transcriptional regulator [Roseateles sp.]|uniref:GntR family transcriptional regulator n=1 Tax=Roseateles sp. TaxID=1971397 RepID=UPI0039EAEAA9